MTVVPDHEWTLDQTSGALIDTGSVGGADGTATGTTSLPGVFTNGRRFDAPTDIINCGTPSATDITTQDFSFSFWLWLLDAQNFDRWLVSKNIQTAGNRSYGVLLRSSSAGTNPQGLAIITSQDGSAERVAESNWPLQVGHVYHVVYTHDAAGGSATDKLYVNAFKIVEDTGALDPLNSTSAAFAVGNQASAGSGAQGCLLDNVQFYANKVLSQAEVDGFVYPSSPFSITSQIPAPGTEEVDPTSNVSFTLGNSLWQVTDSATKIYLREKLAYDGAAGGFQTGFTAGSSSKVANGNGFDFVVDPDASAGLFESSAYTFRVVSEDADGNTLDETWAFYTADVERVRNSGFEEPDAVDPAKPDDWNWRGHDPTGDLGVKRGRVESPSIWTPPQGTHVLALGSTDTVEDLGTAGFQQLVEQFTIDFTDYNFLTFDYKIVTPSSFHPGVTWYLDAVIDTSTALWSRSYTTGDESETAEGTAVIDITTQQGVHNVSFVLSMDAGDRALFDNDKRMIESFKNWSQEMQLIVETALTRADFDAATKNIEDFGLWAN